MQKSIEIGDKIELLTQSIPGHEQSIYYSKIQEITADGELIILAPMESGRIIPLELNQDYGMCVYTEKGLYRCEVVVTGRSKSENLYLISVEIQTTLQKYQRRQYYRLDCILTFQYKDDSNQIWNEGTILDISGGGIRFSSKVQLIKKKGIINHLVLEIDDVEKELYLSGVIVDSVETKYREHVYENRVEFDIIDIEDREIIIKYIFEEERRRRKNKKGM